MSYIQQLFRKKYFYLVIALIPVMIWAAGILAILSSPYTGLNYVSTNDRYYIASVDDGSPSDAYKEMIGCQVLSIGDFQPVRWDLTKNPNLILDRDDFVRYTQGNAYLSKYYTTKKPITIELLSTQNQKKYITIEPVKLSLIKVIERSSNFILTAFITLLIGVVIIFRKADDIRARVFFLITFFIALYLFVLSLFLSSEIPPLAHPVIATSLLIRNTADYYLEIAIIHFFLIFPSRTRIASSRPFLAIIYTLPLILSTLYWWKLIQVPSTFVTILVLVIIIILGFWRYFTAVSPEDKAGTGLILMSFIVCGTGLLGYAVMQSLDLKHFIDGSVLILLANIIPLSMAFAISKYKIMDIDTLFDNTLIYLTTLGIFALIDILFIYILSLNHLTTLDISDLWWAVAGVWFIIFSYIPVRNSIQVLVKRLLKREIYDTDKVIIEFQKQLLSVDNPDKIKNILINTIETALHPKQLSFVNDNKTNENGLSFPLKGLNDEIGILRLGDKHSGNTYTKEDIKLVETLANMAAIVIESISIREKAILEKQEIAREIHDNIGHSLIMAKYMAAETTKGKELENILDNGLSDLREVLSLADGEKQILADFIEHVYKRGEYLKDNEKIRLTIETKTEDETLELPYQIRSNLMKIIQEGISNAIKYSGGDSIKILIEQVGQKLAISISDNGKGFDTSKVLPAKHKGLKNMAQRAQMIGAELSVTSSEKVGTQISISIDI